MDLQWDTVDVCPCAAYSLAVSRERPTTHRTLVFEFLSLSKVAQTSIVAF
jgi:hypothetical protein